jgi:hypothetical protein
LTNSTINRFTGKNQWGKVRNEAKMSSLQNQNMMWELVRATHDQMIKEAQREHLARMARAQKPGWLSNLFRRLAPAQTPTVAINPNATPELG